MGSEFTFYDYVDENGNNVIKDWLNSEAKDAKAHFNQVIPHLEATPPPWSTKYVKRMEYDWKGFSELPCAKSTGRLETLPRLPQFIPVAETTGSPCNSLNYVKLGVFNIDCSVKYETEKYI